MATLAGVDILRSRPTLKGYVRTSSAFFSSVSSLLSQYLLDPVHGALEVSRSWNFGSYAMKFMGEVMGIYAS